MSSLVISTVSHRVQKNVEVVLICATPVWVCVSEYVPLSVMISVPTVRISVRGGVKIGRAHV